MSSYSIIAFSPLLPAPLLAVFVLPALLAVFYALVRRSPGSSWRLLLVLTLGTVLLNPSLVTEQRSPLRDVALVVVDNSPSQNLPGRTEQAAQALRELRDRLRALPGLDVRVTESPRGGDETRLFHLADQALADVPENRRAGLILISDGQIHDIPEATKAPRYGPVHLLLTGQPDEADRRLIVVENPGYGMVGQSVQATVRVEDLPGQNGGSTATLLVHRADGGSERLQVSVGEDVRLTVPVTHAGLNLLALEAESLPGELSAGNNRAVLAVNGVRDRLRVLLVSGFPSNSERVWRNILKSDPAVDLVHFTILRPPGKTDYVRENELSLIPFPVHELFAVKLRQFDLLIFDRYSERNMLSPNHLLNVADYVRAGGAILDASGGDLAGSDSLATTPLGPLLPGQPDGSISDQPFQPAITPAGRRHPVTAHLPGLQADGRGNWGPWFRIAGLVPATDSSVLLEGPRKIPLLLLREVGEGRIAQLASEQIWLWARGYGGGGPQGELLRPLLHWLMKEPELEAERLTGEITGSRLTIIRRSPAPDGSPVDVSYPDGRNERVAMRDNGVFATGGLDISEPGIYRLTDATHSALVMNGRPDAPEMLDQRSSTAPLADLLRTTRGGSFRLSEQPDGPELRRIPAGRSAAGRTWLGLAENGGYSVSGFSSLPLMPLVPVALLAMLATALAWRREGT